MLMKSKNVRQLELSDPRWVWTFWYGQNKRSMKILQIAKIQGYHLVQLFLLSPKMVSVQSYGQRRPPYGHLKFGHLDIKKFFIACPDPPLDTVHGSEVRFWISWKTAEIWPIAYLKMSKFGKFAPQFEGENDVVGWSSLRSKILVRPNTSR